MIAYTANHPAADRLAKRMKDRRWIFKSLTEERRATIERGERLDPLPSLFLLPFYCDKEKDSLDRIVKYADQANIPLLFVLNSSDSCQTTINLPVKALYDTVILPVKERDLSAKMESLLHMNIKLLSSKIQEEEFLALKSKLDEDLFFARTVQKVILPPPLEKETISLNSIFEPSSQLSGDLFFWEEIEDGQYGVIVMDVNGHGVHAALISMSMRSLLPGLIKRVKEPAIISSELNWHMTKLFDKFHIAGNYKIPYFTAFIAHIDTAARRLTYVNSGHPPGMLYEPGSKSVRLLSKGSLPIGLVPDLQIEGESITYEPHSKLLLYTDGLIETPKHENILLLDGIKNTFINKAEENADNLLDDILLTRMQHSEIKDDICIVYGKLT